VIKKNFILIFSLIFNLAGPLTLHAYDAGSRGAYTRGGWVGAEYVGMGRAAEVVADDVFSIYWNPAGLVELKGKKRLTEKEIQEKARNGRAGDISEQDLLNFSEKKNRENVFQVGTSAAMLDAEREAGFAGAAFNISSAVVGIGFYSITSTGINEYDESGNYLGDNLKYIGSAGYLSLGWSAGISNIGVSLKGLYERIADTEYAGAGADIGVQVSILPFLKIGFVIQDMGSGLYPMESSDEIESKYQFASPSLKFGGALTSDTGFTIAMTGIKKLEQEDFQLNAGIRYQLMKSVNIYLGLNDSNFSSGMMIKVKRVLVSYAFTIDKIDYGYNNIASVTILF
jgi:hypothetical protein